MTKPRTKSPRTPLPETVLDLENFDSGTDPAVSKLMAEMGLDPDGENNYVCVYHLIDGVEFRVFKGAPAEYDLDALAQRHGSGAYLVRWYATGDTGRYGIRGSHTFNIKLDPDKEARLKNPTLAQGASAPVDAAAIAATVAQAIAATLAPVLAGLNKPGPDPMTMFSQMAAAMKDLMPAAVAPPSPSNATAQPPLTQLRDMLEFAKMLRMDIPPDDDETPRGGAKAGPWDVLARIVGAYAPVLQQAAQVAQVTQGAAGQSVPGAQANPGAPSLPPPQPSGAPGQSMSMEGDPMYGLRQGLAFLTSMSDAGREVALYADLVLDTIPDDDDKFEPLLRSEGWLDFLASVQPEVRSTPARVKWFTELRTEILRLWDAPPDASMPDGAPPSGVPHAF